MANLTRTQQAFFSAAKGNMSLHRMLEAGLKASKDGPKTDPPPSTTPGTPGTLASVGALLAANLLSSIVQSANDPTVVAGEPPLTRSLLDRIVAFFAAATDAKLSSSETRVLQELATEVWKRASQEEMASLVALASDTGTAEEKHELVSHFFGLPWAEPFLFWANGVHLRITRLGDSIDPELQAALNRVEEHKKQSQNLSLELKKTKENLASLKVQLEGAITARKDAAAGQEALQRKLNELLSSPSATDKNATPEQRVRVLLVRATANGLFIDPHIPQKKAVNARLECQLPPAERMLGLLDLTLFGSAKDAVVFGVNTLYYHLTSERFSIAYSDLAHVAIECSGGTVKLTPNNGSTARAINPSGSGCAPEQLAALLKSLAA